MKYLLVFFLLLFIFSCENEKVIELPEITHSEISIIDDVSAAYLFYDETKPDSLELNRKNLISSTNWLVNVDKRLTLKQVIPHIKFLQDKKLNSSHKKEGSKNYFTCNDLSKKNLGFIEFTNTTFYFENEYEYFKGKKKALMIGFIDINSLNDMHLSLVEEGHDLDKFGSFALSDLNKNLKEFNTEYEILVFINFNSKMMFQDYISVKSKLKELDNKHIKISEDELIYN